MAEMVLQRIVMPPRRGLSRLYCRFDGEPSRPRERGRRTIALSRGAVFRTDTWFNAFFESYWREYTSLSELVLQLRVSGAGSLRVYQRFFQEEQRLIQRIDFSDQYRELRVELADAWQKSDRFGMLFFEIECHSPCLVMHRAEWAASKIKTRPLGLVAAFCTFNRASQLIRNITALLADSTLVELLERIIVVDQGREKVRDHPAFADLKRKAAGRLQLVEQDNHGGAGGFTRCILEAQNTGSATHILLMDDDIILEPESILRAAAFLSLARGDLAVGGHMLDRFRSSQLVESGSRYLPERVRIDEPSRHRLDRAEDLMPFLEPRPRHYNGWWFFAFPLVVLQRAGLPLPLFLRGDDLEFGCRLMRQGVPTVSPPGIAVWHEPCERKGRGWHAFYELRNQLIVGALHFPIVRARTVARQFLSRLIDELLTYDYYESWLLCEAVVAYLRGPEVLGQPSHALQRRLQAMGEKLMSKAQPSDDTVRAAIKPRVKLVPRAARVWRWWLVFRNVLLPSPSERTLPQKLLLHDSEQWYDISSADVVAVAEPHHANIVVLRRSRSRFFRFLLRGMWLALRLLVGYHKAVRRWRVSASALTSRTFWMKHLRPIIFQTHLKTRSADRYSNRSRTIVARTANSGIDRGDHAQAQDSLL